MKQKTCIDRMMKMMKSRFFMDTIHFFHQKDTPIYLEDRQKIGIFANAKYIKKLFTI